MNKFGVSVWAKDGEFGIRPIGSIEEAQVFLESWPEMERTPLYYAAANSIAEANKGAIPPDEAKKALAAFLEDAGALAEEGLTN